MKSSSPSAFSRTSTIVRPAPSLAVAPSEARDAPTARSARARDLLAATNVDDRNVAHEPSLSERRAPSGLAGLFAEAGHRDRNRCTRDGHLPLLPDSWLTMECPPPPHPAVEAESFPGRSRDIRLAPAPSALGGPLRSSLTLGPHGLL